VKVLRDAGRQLSRKAGFNPGKNRRSPRVTQDNLLLHMQQKFVCAFPPYVHCHK
jgi:hypothetical protein